MRPVDFVPAEGVEIYTQRLYIDRAVWGVGYAVNTEEGGGDSVDQIRD